MLCQAKYLVSLVKDARKVWWSKLENTCLMALVGQESVYNGGSQLSTPMSATEKSDRKERQTRPMACVIYRDRFPEDF